MFWKKKKSFCVTCPERSPACLAGQCKIRQCVLCYWCVDVGWFKSFSAAESRHQCKAPALANPVTGAPKDSCSNARSFESKCGPKGRYFLHKEWTELQATKE